MKRTTLCADTGPHLNIPAIIGIATASLAVGALTIGIIEIVAPIVTALVRWVWGAM